MRNTMQNLVDTHTHAADIGKEMEGDLDICGLKVDEEIVTDHKPSRNADSKAGKPQKSTNYTHLSTLQFFCLSLGNLETNQTHIRVNKRNCFLFKFFENLQILRALQKNPNSRSSCEFTSPAKSKGEYFGH